jgi:hypothetical protein
MAINYPIHIEVENKDVTRTSFKTAWALLIISALILAAGFYTLGTEGMLNVSSPDFMPVPHAVSAIAALFGLIWLVKAMRSAGHANVFGKSIVDCNKPVLGGVLAGTLKIEKSAGLSAPIALRLHCDWNYKIYYEDGENSKPARAVLWEHAQELPSGGAEIGIPFRFAIPATCLPSGWRTVPRGPKENAAIKKTAGSVTWHVTATSKCRGIDYLADFEIRMRPENYVDQPDGEDDAEELDDFDDYNKGEER